MEIRNPQQTYWVEGRINRLFFICNEEGIKHPLPRRKESWGRVDLKDGDTLVTVRMFENGASVEWQGVKESRTTLRFIGDVRQPVFKEGGPWGFHGWGDTGSNNGGIQFIEGLKNAPQFILNALEQVWVHTGYYPVKNPKA